MNKRRRLKKERNKADKLWKTGIRTEFCGKCAVCGSERLVNCHHLLPREMAEYRHQPINGITLCPLHHKYSRLLSAHKNSLAFAVWLKDNHPSRWQWVQNEAKRIFEAGEAFKPHEPKKEQEDGGVA